MAKLIIDQALSLINSGARVFVQGKANRILIEEKWKKRSQKF
jgi:hypothetical protein